MLSHKEGRYVRKKIPTQRQEHAERPPRRSPSGVSPINNWAAESARKERMSQKLIGPMFSIAAHQTKREGPRDRLGTACYLKFHKNSFHVRLDRFRCNFKRLCDSLV